VIDIDIFCCPRCHSPLRLQDAQSIVCTNGDCPYGSGEGFPILDGQPALVDFERSVIRRERLVAAHGGSEISRERSGLFHLLRRLVKGEGKITDRNAESFLDRLLADGGKSGAQPRVLVVGGGTVRSCARRLYDRLDIDLLSFDVYASPLTNFIGDGHHIALPDASVDGVWIEAVLEHVLEPHVVVSEIHRVLKPGGLVYAETPFMQQVHEGAYDFTRFTHSGHRWLFRRFEETDSGALGGVGTAMIWSTRHFWYGLTGSRRLGIILALPIFWLRFLDRFSRPGPALDAASGYYSLGAGVKSLSSRIRSSPTIAAANS